MRRRALVLGGTVAAGAVAAAAGVGVWRWRSGTTEDAPVDVWSLSFATVDGVPMPMARLRGQALLLNFWATWCVPCATEMPLLDAFARAESGHGWNVLALAVDTADPVRRFVAERALSLPIALAGAEGLDLSRSLGNNLGALPFSVAFDAGGAPVQRKLGKLDRALLERWVATPSK